MARDPINGEWYERYRPNDECYLVKDVVKIPQNYYAWTVIDPVDEFGGGTIYTITETPKAGDAIFDENGNVIGDYNDNFYYNGLGYRLNQTLTSYSSSTNSIGIDGTESSVRVKIEYQENQLIAVSEIPRFCILYPGTTSTASCNIDITETELQDGIYFYLPTDRASMIYIGGNTTKNYYIMVNGSVVASHVSNTSYSFTPSSSTPLTIGVCQEGTVQ